MLSVNMFACSVNGQNDEFQTYINCHKVFTACAATGDKTTVHKESQPVPGIKIESYILATFLNTIFRGNHAKKLSRIKGINNLKKVRNTCHCR